MDKEKDGVWRTIRGRRIFIGKGEDLATAMKKSGKFTENHGMPRREDVMKAKKQVAFDEAKERWHKEYDPKKYKTEDYQDPKKRALMEKRKDKVNKDQEKAWNDKQEYMDLYDKDRDDSELSWQDRVEKNNREMNKRADELREKKNSPEYYYHDEKWQDDYYGNFRETEAKNASIKEEPDDAPYEYVEAYKGFKEKADKLEGAKYDSQGNLESYNQGATWTGKEYTNDEFMEHLTDANWHHERRMIEEAGLTNKQLREFKKDIKLDRYGVDLDPKKTQELIDKVKKEFPAKETTIADFKAKKQSNNKVETWEEKVKRLEKENAKNKNYEIPKQSDKKTEGHKIQSEEAKAILRQAQKDYEDTINQIDGYYKKVEAFKKEREQVDKNVKYFNKEDEKRRDNYYKDAKRWGFGYANEDNIPVYNNNIDYTGDFTHANLSKVSDDDLIKALNKQSELYHEASNRQVGDRRTRNGKNDEIFKKTDLLRYENGMKKLNEEMQNRNMPRYNIYNKKNNSIMVSSPTKEMADKQLKEMYETDKKLGAHYGWKEYPEYEIKSGHVDDYLNEVKDNNKTIKAFKEKKQSNNKIKDGDLEFLRVMKRSGKKK